MYQELRQAPASFNLCYELTLADACELTLADAQQTHVSLTYAGTFGKLGGELQMGISMAHTYSSI